MLEECQPLRKPSGWEDESEHAGQHASLSGGLPAEPGRLLEAETGHPGVCCWRWD